MVNQSAAPVIPVESWTMSNGLRVVADRLPYLRSVSIGVWFRVGSLMEKPEESGLSHFLEHMVFKGTAHRTARQISEEMDAVGGQLNAFTGKDCTCFYAKVVDDFLPLAVDILADLTVHATLEPSEFERERGVILEEIAMDEDDPEDLSHDLLAGAQYRGQSAAMPILGPEKQVSAYTREELQAYRQSHYRPQDTVISVCGNFDPEALKALLERFFGEWRSDAEWLDFPAETLLHGQVAIREKDTEQLHLCMGFPGFGFDAPEMVAYGVFGAILGGSMSSRLFQRIREELGMAYSIYESPNSFVSCGSFTVYAGVSPKNGPRVLEEIQSEMTKLLRDGITEKEFRDTQQQFRCSYLLGLESPGGRMQANGRLLLHKNIVRQNDEMDRRIAAVTMDEVMDAARAVLLNPPSLAVIGRTAGEYADWKGAIG